MEQFESRELEVKSRLATLSDLHVRFSNVNHLIKLGRANTSEEGDAQALYRHELYEKMVTEVATGVLQTDPSQLLGFLDFTQRIITSGINPAIPLQVYSGFLRSTLLRVREIVDQKQVQTDQNPS